MSKLKVFVIMFNRVTQPKIYCEQLSKYCEVILIDNNSTYEPLLEWYSTKPYEIIRMDKNYKAFGFFYQNVLSHFKNTEEYLVTDSDLSIEGIADDFIDVMRNGLDLFPEKWKCGLSLKIDDLPENEMTNTIKAWEERHFSVIENGFYLADVATTLALYRSPSPLDGNYYSGIRTPYMAKHLPWYMTKEDVLNNPEEMFFYKNTETKGWNPLNF